MKPNEKRVQLKKKQLELKKTGDQIAEFLNSPQAKEIDAHGQQVKTQSKFMPAKGSIAAAAVKDAVNAAKYK